jgi:hypothetical protein
LVSVATTVSPTKASRGNPDEADHRKHRLAAPAQITQSARRPCLYDVKTTASGIPDPKQAERLKSVLNGWQPGGQRSIKVGMVERRWVASAGWVTNARGKNAIGLVRMIGLAAGVAQTSQAAHAMWSFKDDDPEFQSLLNWAQRVKQNDYMRDTPPAEQRAHFIKWEVMPFLKKRFGDSAALDVAGEAAFRKFLEDLK